MLAAKDIKIVHLKLSLKGHGTTEELEVENTKLKVNVTKLTSEV